VSVSAPGMTRGIFFDLTVGTCVVDLSSIASQIQGKTVQLGITFNPWLCNITPGQFQGFDNFQSGETETWIMDSCEH